MNGMGFDEWLTEHQARVEGWDEEPESICVLCLERIQGEKGYYDKDIGLMCRDCATDIAWMIIEDNEIEEDQKRDDKHSDIMGAWEVSI